MPEESKETRTLLENAIRKRDELNTFIKVLQEMLGLSSEPSQTEGAPSTTKQTEAPAGDFVDPLAAVYPGMFFGRSQPQAVRMLLEKMRPRPIPMRTLLAALEKGGLKVGGKKPSVNLWGVLNRNSDQFILVPKAGWALTEWYEASVLAKMRKEDAKGGPQDAEGSNGEAPNDKAPKEDAQ